MAGTFSGLIEREEEVARLEAALVSAKKGNGSLLLLEGAAGVGKTRLLSEVAAAASEKGARVLSTSCTELERDAAFGVARRLFGPALESNDPERLRQLASGLASLALPLFVGSTVDARHGADARAGLVEGLYWLLVNLAYREAVPVLIAADDIQWADASSVRFLDRVAATVEELPVVMVLTCRAGEPLGHEVALLASRPACQVLQLQPFSASAVERVVRDAFLAADPAFVAACGQATGGNPFLLHELLLALRADRCAATAEEARHVATMVPDTVLRSIVARLGRLSESAGALASALAVLGNSTPLRLAAALAGLDARTAEPAADELVAADIVAPGDPVSFSHSLIAAAVEADLGPFARSGAHRRATQLLAADGAAPERLVPHLLMTSPAGDPWVVTTLRTAAMEWQARGETAAAGRALRRALAEPPPAETRTDVLVELALAGAEMRDPEALPLLREALRVLGDDSRRGNTVRALVGLLYASDDYAAAVDEAERGFRELRAEDPAREALLLDYLIVANMYLPARERVARLLEPHLAAVRAGRLPTEPALCGRLATRLATGNDPPSLVRTVAERALTADTEVDDLAHGHSLAYAAAALYYVDLLDVAEEGLTIALERARGRGSVVSWGIASQCRAYVRRPLGRLADAISDIDQAVALRRAGWDFPTAWIPSVLAQIYVELGDLEAARAALGPGERPTASGVEKGFALAARGRIELAAGNPARALTDLLAAGQHLAEYGITHPGADAWRSDAAIAAAQSGERTEAASLAEAAVAEGRAVGVARLEGVALRAAGLVTGGERGLSLLCEAVTALERSPAALERARALLDLGAALRRAGRRIDARDPLRRALDLADGLGAVALATRARGELLAAGARPRRAPLTGVASLTPSERRIAELAARGSTNTAIARELFISRETVEWHLRQVFRKLAISSRRQLAETLRE